MSDISKMTDKQLRNEVQLLRDELAIMKRKYEDIIYNLDTDNFSSRFVKEQGDMKTAIKVTAKGLEAKVSNEEFQNELSLTAEKFETSISNLDLTLSASILLNANAIATEVNNRTAADNELSTKITQSAETIKAEVKEELENGGFVNQATLDIKADEILSTVSQTYATTGYVSSEISQTANEISLILSGEYTDDILNGYLTGIEIKPHQIKMIDTDVYSVYNSDGLRFYDSKDQIEGWAIEPSGIGGVLNYYVNGGNCYRFGSGESGEGYTASDISIKALNSQRSGFVVDVTECGYPYIKFVGLNDYSVSQNEPQILANGMKLATQSWVLDNAGSGGTVVARFG